MRGSIFLIFVTSLLLTVGLTGLVKRYALRVNLLDVPNQRSSHQIVTPRGGGLSVVVVFLAAVIGLHFFGHLPTDIYYSLLVGGGLVSAIGFVDDHNHMPALWRFITQVVAATFAIVMLGGLPDVQLGNRVVDLGFAGDVMALVFTVWLINLYNFMDGIDGIAAVEAICIVGSTFVISSAGDHGFVTNLHAVFMAAVLGFLVWNWPPAKIFMGDVGSGFIGFVLAIFAIISGSLSLLPIWCWLILAGVFVVDSTITLVTRAINGEQWYSAHKSHGYQKASRLLNGHRPVTLAVLGINLLWLLPLAWVASTWPEYGWWLTIIAWIPLILVLLGLKAGRPDPAA
jgi:Fuc2NAc and GlcNAc transferase